MGYKAYPEYKESGIEWLGKVPSHWRVERLRFSVQTNPSKSEIKHLDESLQVSFVPMDAVGELGGLRLDSEKEISEVSNGYSYFADGDVLIAKITPCFENGKGAIAKNLKNGAGFGTTELHVLRCENNLNRDFLFYLSISHSFREIGASQMLGAGGQKRITDEFIRDFRTVLPSLLEQKKIATFLNYKTAQIDRLIEKKQELIAKLQEQKIASTTLAVTKGLDSNVILRDSGIEWLGSVPEHWDIHQLSLLTETIQTGPFGSQLHAADYVEGGIPLINPAHLISGNIVPDEQSAVDAKTVERLNRHKLKPADIIMARRGEIGRCAFVEEEQAGWLCGTGSLLIRFHKGNSRFFSTVISSGGFSKKLELHAVGTTMLNLNPTIVGRMLVPVPPLEEQYQIVAYIDRATKKINQSISKAREAIARLQEYRTALITAAVTGQIDVRAFRKEQ